MIAPATPLVMPMGVEDLDEVVALASASFDPSWPRQVFEEELGRDWAYVWVLRPRLTAAIAAFVAFWWVRDEVHVLNLATLPSMRRRGYARGLMDELLVFARARSVRYLSLEVSATNAAALALYEGLGFESIGVRPHYYAHDEDAVVMLHRCERLAERGRDSRPVSRSTGSRGTGSRGTSRAS